MWQTETLRGSGLSLDCGSYESWQPAPPHLTPHTVLSLQGLQSPEHLYGQSPCLDVSPTATARVHTQNDPTVTALMHPHSSGREHPTTDAHHGRNRVLGDPSTASPEPGCSGGRDTGTEGVEQQQGGYRARGWRERAGEWGRGTRPRSELGGERGHCAWPQAMRGVWGAIRGDLLQTSWQKRALGLQPSRGNYEGRQTLPTQGAHPRPGLDLRVGQRGVAATPGADCAG